MNIFLNDIDCKEYLQPFSHTRHIADIRIGILTIRQKWELLLDGKGRMVDSLEGVEDALSIPANVIPTIENFDEIIALSISNKLVIETATIKIMYYPWHIFQLNDWSLRNDFKLITKGRSSSNIHASNYCSNPKDIFIEAGAQIKNCSLNADNGPIYIGENVQIMEGTLIRGPFSIGGNSVVKMGSKIYGATTVGPNCVVGGEIKNSILFENSNKAHDGYLGDSVIGAWCNLGAGTSNSNIKNTGGNINYELTENAIIKTDFNKGGLIMGDYSRSAINTSFNTATIVGVCCNVFGAGFPRKNVPNFTWGNEKYEFEKAIRDIDNWKKMKGVNITETEIEKLKNIYL